MFSLWDIIISCGIRGAWLPLRAALSVLSLGGLERKEAAEKLPSQSEALWGDQGEGMLRVWHAGGGVAVA